MTEVDPELHIIKEVEKYDCLYDKNSLNFKNHVKKDEIWLAIANTVGVSVDDAKRLWKNLRERYSKERKQAAKLPAGGKPLWPYFEPMKFMQKHIITRKRLSYHLMSKLGKREHKDEEKFPPQLPTESTEQLGGDSCKRMKFEEGSENLFDLYAEEVVVSDADAPYLPPEEPCVVMQSALPTKSAIPPKVAVTVENQLKEVLYTCSKYMEHRDKPDKNMTFGQYVGLTLSEMPAQEQNYKRLKIVEILNEDLSM